MRRSNIDVLYVPTDLKSVKVITNFRKGAS